jgi:hypothetical protein
MTTALTKALLWIDGCQIQPCGGAVFRVERERNQRHRPVVDDPEPVGSISRTPAVVASSVENSSAVTPAS